MTPEKFLIECNRSPLFRKIQPIAKAVLSEVGFQKNEYSIATDFPKLADILFFITPTVVENKDLEYLRQKRTAKDTIHSKLIKLYDNKKFIKKLRQELKMPYD